MENLPIVCKFTYQYKYRQLKEKNIYALLLEYDPNKIAYYANLIEENGTTHGRHYDKWVDWDDNIITKSMIPMESLPNRVRKTVNEHIAIFEEVNRRCKHLK